MDASECSIGHGHKSQLTDSEIGLCLSGGGALGFAHIGVIQALEENFINPVYVSGTSMGAIIGSLYAAGYTAFEMLQMLRDDKLYKVTRLMTFKKGFPSSGLAEHSVLRAFIREMIPHNSFEQLNRNLHVCVTNLNTGEWEIKTKGNELDRWIAASATIPGLFEVMKRRDNVYVDGGVLNNLPAQSLTGLCNIIIGVDVMPYVGVRQMKKPTDAILASTHAVLHQNSLEGRKLCKHLIEPMTAESHHMFSFESYQSLYQIGYNAAIEYLGRHML